MDDITKKRINECVKRTLSINSGKELNVPLCFCFSCDTNYDNKCSNNTNPDRTPEENNNSVRRYLLTQDCFGCAFYKTYFYASDALRALKTYFSLALQKDKPSGFERSASRIFGLGNSFFKNLLSLTREKCYLTFSNSLFNEAVSALSEMSYEQLYNLIIEVYNFCKENNIK